MNVCCLILWLPADTRAHQGHAIYIYQWSRIYSDGRYLAYFKRSFVRKNYSEPEGIDRASEYIRTSNWVWSHPTGVSNGHVYLTNPHPNDPRPNQNKMRAGGRRDLPYSYWPNQHNFYGFAYGITDRYLLSMWDAGTLLAYDDGVCVRPPACPSVHAYIHIRLGVQW